MTFTELLLAFLTAYSIILVMQCNFKDGKTETHVYIVLFNRRRECDQ